jgi:hypothetical protein
VTKKLMMLETNMLMSRASMIGTDRDWICARIAAFSGSVAVPQRVMCKGKRTRKTKRNPHTTNGTRERKKYFRWIGCT